VRCPTFDQFQWPRCNPSPLWYPGPYPIKARLRHSLPRLRGSSWREFCTRPRLDRALSRRHEEIVEPAHIGSNVGGHAEPADSHTKLATLRPMASLTVPIASGGVTAFDEGGEADASQDADLRFEAPLLATRTKLCWAVA
jgi:hypothetical protein